MAEPYIGEIRIFGFNFAPRGWMFCSGQLLPLSQYTALFSILGTTYGGDGTTNFALPNFQGRAGVDAGSGPGLSPYFLGEMSGTSTVTLLQTQMPSHDHGVVTKQGKSATQDVHAPSSQAFLGPSTPAAIYAEVQPQNSLSPSAIGANGNSLPHNNMQPYLVLNFCICISGVFPPRS